MPELTIEIISERVGACCALRKYAAIVLVGNSGVCLEVLKSTSDLSVMSQLMQNVSNDLRVGKVSIAGTTFSLTLCVGAAFSWYAVACKFPV